MGDQNKKMYPIHFLESCNKARGILLQFQTLTWRVRNRVAISSKILKNLKQNWAH